MSTPKPKLTEEDMPKINNKILYSSRDVSVYRSIFEEYDLSNEQIDDLLSDVGVGTTSSVEAKIAEEVAAYLKSMKK